MATWITKALIATILSTGLVATHTTPVSALSPTGVTTISTTTSTSEYTPLSDNAAAQLRHDIALAKEFTSGSGSATSFNKQAALNAGMSSKFASDYETTMVRLRADDKADSDSFSVTVRPSSIQIAPDGDSGVVRPMGGKGSLDCLISMTGLTLAAASLMAATFASGGVAALALAGYSVSAIAAVKACYYG